MEDSHNLRNLVSEGDMMGVVVDDRSHGLLNLWEVGTFKVRSCFDEYFPLLENKVYWTSVK